MRHRIPAPDRWGVHQRKDFNKPRLPIHTKMLNSLRYLIAVVQLLSCVQCFLTPWTVARQASLSFTNSQSLLKLISTELVMLSNHFILCRYLVFLWDIWFSLVNSNLLMFQLPSLCWKNSYISWLHPCLFGAVSWSYQRCCVLGLSPQFCWPNKT